MASERLLLFAPRPAAKSDMSTWRLFVPRFETHKAIDWQMLRTWRLCAHTFSSVFPLVLPLIQFYKVTTLNENVFGGEFSPLWAVTSLFCRRPLPNDLSRVSPFRDDGRRDVESDVVWQRWGDKGGSAKGSERSHAYMTSAANPIKILIPAMLTNPDSGMQIC